MLNMKGIRNDLEGSQLGKERDIKGRDGLEQPRDDKFHLDQERWRHP